MHYLSACLIAKNEASYLDEWLTFHQLVGVEHFYIFDNNSTDNTADILRPYVSRGQVTHIPWRARPGQVLAYDYALKSFREETKWLAFIDTDEFLHGVAKDDLKSIVSSYEDYSALVAHWKIFGSSHRQQKPPGLVIENYLLRAPDSFPPHGHPKSIVKIEEALNPKDPHTFHTKKGTVNESKRVLDLSLNTVQEQWSYNVIAINHYFTKSKEESIEKMKRGRVSVDPRNPEFIRKMQLFEEHDRNDVRDETILRFLPKLKDRLNVKMHAA